MTKMVAKDYQFLAKICSQSLFCLVLPSIYSSNTSRVALRSVHSGLRYGHINFRISYGNETRLNYDSESMKSSTLRRFKRVKKSILAFKKMVLSLQSQKG